MNDRFEAIADCPRCGRLDIHQLRAPDLTKPEPEPYEPERQRIIRFDGTVVRTIETTTPPMREADYEIIRTCKCGHEWGQT